MLDGRQRILIHCISTVDAGKVLLIVGVSTANRREILLLLKPPVTDLYRYLKRLVIDLCCLLATSDSSILEQPENNRNQNQNQSRHYFGFFSLKNILIFTCKFL